MYSKSLSKGVLVDMLQGRKVVVDGESKYCFAPLEFVATWIAANLRRSGLVEVGARDSIRLREVAGYLGGGIEFEGPVDHQEIQNPAVDFPHACKVLAFLDQVKTGTSLRA
jgi:hypothetical protein